MGSRIIADDTANKLQDLSGIVLKPGENPYAAFINACNNDPEEIKKLYSAHRIRRNEQQKSKFLSPDFKELVIDQTLLRLERPEVEPGFRDVRNCLVFWARPPEHIIQLSMKLQKMLQEACPGLWLMPPQRMHLTTLEVAFSKTPEEIDTLVQQLRPPMATIVNHFFHHRSRLVKPMISHDLSAFAVSFVPATSEPHLSPPTQSLQSSKAVQEESYTYHHARRDVFDMVQSTGVDIGSRYQVPSAHITLGRFLDQEGHDTPEKRAKWLQAIDAVNEWLETKVWEKEGSEWCGDWVVGQERGLDFRAGTLWYGGGRTVMLGEGF